jgi:hypothetical protein
VLVNVFLVVGDDGFGDCLADGVDLGCVSTTGYADADIDIGCNHKSETCPIAISLSILQSFRFMSSWRGIVRTELVKTEDEDWFIDLESEDFRLNEGQRLSVDLDDALSCFAVCDSFSTLLAH